MNPSEKYNLPVIGKIYCKLEGTYSDGTPLDNPVDEYEVIRVIEGENGKTFVCNKWNSEDVPQVVPEFCVIKFEEY